MDLWWQESRQRDYLSLTAKSFAPVHRTTSGSAPLFASEHAHLNTESHKGAINMYPSLTYGVNMKHYEIT